MRSRDTIDTRQKYLTEYVENYKPFFQKKELSDKQKSWLKSHDESNWQNIVLTQDYTNAKKQYKKLVWKLPGTERKKESCGKWQSKGCANVWGHPENKFFVKHSKRSCFRARCETCWLEKWLARESHRATQRIENYIDVFKHLQFARSPHLQRKYLKPIHVIVSPSWKDKFLSFDKLKSKARKLINQAGIEGGLMIYHPFGFDKMKNEWVIRPHFHILGFGWVIHTKKISDSEGWVIKNKGLRDSLHSTIYYQLSHAGVSDEVHSITWFGSLGYRAKYANLFKVEDDDETDFCDYCNCMLVEFDYVGQGKPPDFEFVGLVDVNDWKPRETLEQAVDRKNRFKNQFKQNINEKSKFDIPKTLQVFNQDCEAIERVPQ